MLLLQESVDAGILAIRWWNIQEKNADGQRAYMKIENLKYQPDTEENRAFLHSGAEALLALEKQFSK